MTEEERARLTTLTLARLDQAVDRCEALAGRLELIADLIARREFEKTLNQLIDEEREQQEQQKDKKTFGGFNVS